MKEKREFIKNVSMINDAIKFKIDMYNKASYESDRFPLFGIEKIEFIISSLKPKELKKTINILSSVNWGRHVLTTIFPKDENPDEYHSRNGVIHLQEKPVQVLGWQDRKDMFQEGANIGLSWDWIDWGFENEAERRGIDLEWSFFETPRVVGEIKKNDKQLT